MQAGHFAVALVISSYAPELTGGKIDAFSIESMAVALAAHELANFDGIPIMLGWAKKAFHCTWSHTILFAVVLSLLVLLFNPAWFMLVLVSSLVHLLSDMPSSVGLPILLPFTKKRFTLNLWADTLVGKARRVLTSRHGHGYLREARICFCLSGHIRLVCGRLYDTVSGFRGH
jgi:membrane-bound metal-dependent hydrolase YbcI (DUF457 family)